MQIRSNRTGGFVPVNPDKGESRETLEKQVVELSARVVELENELEEMRNVKSHTNT